MSADPPAYLDHAASLAANHLWRASWQGGLAIAVVWSLCRLFRGWPPGVRCWLWRLAYLKLLTALVWAAPVKLPLLPAAPTPAAPRLGSAVARHHFPRPPIPGSAWSSKSSGVEPPHSRGAGPNRGSRWFPASSTRSGSRGAVSAARASQHGLPPRPTWLMLFWLIGASWCGARTARDWRASRRLLGSDGPATPEALTGHCAALCRRFGLPRAPRLWVSEAVGSPLLVAARPPAIVIPPRLLDACDESELRLILAHELAHLRRHDLQWAWLPSVAGSLFFHHPLIWLAAREWRLAQEMACDELAVRVTGASALEYGQMVLKVAAHRRSHPYGEPAAASAAGPYHSLRRRLIAITQIRPLPARRRRVPGALLALTAVAVVVPWQVTARAATQPRSLSREPGRVVVKERSRQRLFLAHQRRLAEQERLRRLELLAHERRLAELEHQRRLAHLAHERRQAREEFTQRLAVEAHRQREARLEQQRFLARLAHERRLAEQEHAQRLSLEAHRLRDTVARQQLLERSLSQRERAQRSALELERHQESALERQRVLERMAQERALAARVEALRQMATEHQRPRHRPANSAQTRRQGQLLEAHRADLQRLRAAEQERLAAIQRALRALDEQLRELEMQRRALEESRLRLQSLREQQRLKEQLLKNQLEKQRSRSEQPSAGNKGHAP